MLLVYLTRWQFATGIKNTSGTGGKITSEYLCEFSENIEMTLMLYSGAWEKMVQGKNLKQKNFVTLSFKSSYSSSLVPTGAPDTAPASSLTGSNSVTLCWPKWSCKLYLKGKVLLIPNNTEFNAIGIIHNSYYWRILCSYQSYAQISKVDAAYFQALFFKNGDKVRR